MNTSPVNSPPTNNNRQYKHPTRKQGSASNLDTELLFQAAIEPKPSPISSNITRLTDVANRLELIPLYQNSFGTEVTIALLQLKKDVMGSSLEPELKSFANQMISQIAGVMYENLYDKIVNHATIHREKEQTIMEHNMGLKPS